MDPSDFVGVLLLVAGVVGVAIQAFAVWATGRRSTDEVHRDTQRKALRWAMWMDVGLLVAGLFVLFVPPIRDLVNQLFG